MIDIDIKMNTKECQKYLGELIKRIGDMRPVWIKFISYYQTEVMPKTWSSRGGMMNTRWANYKVDKKTGKSKYLAWKQKHYPGKPMLVTRGDLYNAVRGGKGWFQKVSKTNLIIGIKGLPHARVHQWGYKNIPQRPYFMTAGGTIPPEAYVRLIQMTENYIREAI